MSEELRIESPNIVERSFSYSLHVIRLFRELEKNSVSRILGKQLLRSGTSIGANIHEAQAAQSKADFVAKMPIAHKEAHESLYWLGLIREAKLIPENQMSDLFNETEQLIKILSSILITSKQKIGSTKI